MRVEGIQVASQVVAEHTLRALSSAASPQDKAATQAELMKKAYERAVSNTKEMSDLIQRANGEAVDQLNHRFTEAMEEMKTLMAKAGIKP